MQKNLKIAHRDLKPQNILVFKNTNNTLQDNNDNYIYKLADFGEAKKIKISKQLNTLRGTELYMSPILYDGLKLDKDDIIHNVYKSDVFSLGYCFVYSASLNFNVIHDVRNLFDMKKIENVLKKYFNGRYSNQFIQCVLKMIEVDERKRIDFLELVPLGFESSIKFKVKNYGYENEEIMLNLNHILKEFYQLNCLVGKNT
jgi:serine/threonine protein kinase